MRKVYISLLLGIVISLSWVYSTFASNFNVTWISYDKIQITHMYNVSYACFYKRNELKDPNGTLLGCLSTNESFEHDQRTAQSDKYKLDENDEFRMSYVSNNVAYDTEWKKPDNNRPFSNLRLPIIVK